MYVSGARKTGDTAQDSKGCEGGVALSPLGRWSLSRYAHSSLVVDAVTLPDSNPRMRMSATSPLARPALADQFRWHAPLCRVASVASAR